MKKYTVSDIRENEKFFKSKEFERTIILEDYILDLPRVLNRIYKEGFSMHTIDMAYCPEFYDIPCQKVVFIKNSSLLLTVLIYAQQDYVNIQQEQI